MYSRSYALISFSTTSTTFFNRAEKPWNSLRLSKLLTWFVSLSLILPLNTACISAMYSVLSITTTSMLLSDLQVKIESSYQSFQLFFT